MNMSSCISVRSCVLLFTFVFYFFSFSPVFGQCQINCISSLEISLDQTGTILVPASLLITDSDNCTGEKLVTITGENGQQVTNNTLDCTHLGQTLVVSITDLDAQISCWSYVTVADYSAPKFINCIDHYVYCNTTIPISEIGNPTFEDNCSTEFTASFTDEVTDYTCHPSVQKIISRTWYLSDSNGNQAEPCIQNIHFQTIQIEDIVLPEDISIAHCENPETAPSVTGFPNFELTSIDDFVCQYDVTYADVNAPLCGNTFKILRTWEIRDWCTNSEIIHQQAIIVIDTIPPLIHCDEDTLNYFVTSQHSCFADVSLIETEVTDNCSDFIVTYDWAYTHQPNQVPLGVYPITAIATDDCNNISTCDFHVQVLDEQAPIAICESNLTVSLDANGNYTLEASFLNGLSTDNCGISDYLVSLGQDFSHSVELDCSQLGIPVTVSLMVVDESGNSGICSAEITIIDNVLPEITCPTDITIKCYEDPTDLTLTGNATASDNCEQYTPTFTDNPDLNICNAGNITRTFSVFERGIEVSCQQTITLEVDTPSVVFPVDITVNCGESDNYDIVGQPIVTAMCPGFFLDTNDEVNADSSCNLVTTRVWKVVDLCQDTIYQSTQIITEIDILPPALINPATDVTLSCSTGDLSSLDDWVLSNGGAIATDLCTDVIWTNNFEGFNFECANTGSATVTFTAADQCGNSSSTTATFSIIDTLNPVFIVLPLDLLLPCEMNAQEEIDVYLQTNGGAIASDQCSEVKLVSEIISGIDSLCSTFEILTTATDLCGFTATAISTITVVDEVAPVFEIAPMDIAILCESGDIESQINAWITDNGGAIANDICGAITWTNDFDFTLPQCGTPTSVVFTATDECGNEASEAATYTVIDNTSPTIVEPAMEITFECDGFGNVVEINNYLDNNGFSTITDNCSELIWSNDYIKIDSICGGTGTSIVNFTATDLCGNSTTTTGLITIEDTTPPNVITPVEELVVECDGFGNVLEFNTWVQANGNIAVEDICSEVEFTFDFNSLVRTCANAGRVFTVFVAADECNNKTNLITNFIIEDTTPPTVDCPEDLVVIDEDLDCSEFIILAPTTATDACNGILVFSYEIDYNSDGTIDVIDDGPNASGDYGIGIHTINYMVEDECGNIGFCQQFIEVVDGVGSDLECVETFLLGIDNTGTATLNPEDIAMISPCVNGSSLLSQSNFSCNDCGNNEVTLTYTDADGTSRSCTTNVFVCDLGGNCDTCVPCAGLAVGGGISTVNNFSVPDVNVNVDGSNAEIITNEFGAYYFEGEANSTYAITPYKNDDPTNGVTTLDLIALQKHILGLNPLESPYQKIAADANNSGAISTLDIVDIQRVILQVADGFTNNTSWRFVDKDFQFEDPDNPFTSTYPETIAIDGLISQELNNDFVAVKIGDINSSFSANLSNNNNRDYSSIPVFIQDQIVGANEIISVPIKLQEPINIEGYQFTLKFDPTLFEFVEIDEFGLNGLKNNNFGLSKINEGILLCNWTNPNPTNAFVDAETIFSLKFKTKSKTRLIDNFWTESAPLKNEVYIPTASKEVELHEFDIQFTPLESLADLNHSLLFQNAPNPFSESTQIKFFLPEKSFVDLQIYDATGRVVWSQQRAFDSGQHEIIIHGNDLENEGIYLCTLNTAFGNETIKLVHFSQN